MYSNVRSIGTYYHDYHEIPGLKSPQSTIRINIIISVSGNSVFLAETCLLRHKTAKMHPRPNWLSKIFFFDFHLKAINYLFSSELGDSSACRIRLVTKKKFSDLNTRFMSIIFSAHISKKVEINNQDKALQLI